MELDVPFQRFLQRALPSPSSLGLCRYLSGNWLELEDDQGRVYYANSATRQTSWEHPADAAVDKV